MGQQSDTAERAEKSGAGTALRAFRGTGVTVHDVTHHPLPNSGLLLKSSWWENRITLFARPGIEPRTPRSKANRPPAQLTLHINLESKPHLPNLTSGLPSLPRGHKILDMGCSFFMLCGPIQFIITVAHYSPIAEQTPLKQKARVLMYHACWRRIGDFRPVSAISLGFLTMFIFIDVSMSKINLESTYELKNVMYWYLLGFELAWEASASIAGPSRPSILLAHFLNIFF